MKRYDLIVVGAGPSGLSAAIEAAKRGLQVVVFDENDRPGGQLFKQIHKFFGSKEHRAKIRGFVIGEELLAEADKAGVKVVLNATVIGLYQDKEIVVRTGEEVSHYKADAIIIATGASENMVDLSAIIDPEYVNAKERHFDPAHVFDFHLEKTVDEAILLPKFAQAMKNGTHHEETVEVSSTNRTVGTILGSEITAHFGDSLREDTFVVKCVGGGGQSFGAFIPKGLTMLLKTVPVASFVILVLIWAGNTNLSFLISMIVAFPILYLNTYSGFQSADQKLLEMAEIYRMTT